MEENKLNPQPVAAADCRERAVLVAVIRDNQDPRQTEEFLDELEFLAETADICSVKRFTQRLPQLRRSRQTGGDRRVLPGA